MPLTSLKLTRTFDATPKAVYRAFTTPSGLVEWVANSCDLDPRVGGRLFIWSETGFQFMGKFTELEPEQHIAFDVHAPTPSHVNLTITAENGLASLTVEQSNLTKEKAAEYRARWETALDNLKSVLETGLDRRFYDRPMLGILISGTVDKDIQERMSLPVDYGILIGGTVPGMGAEGVGLIENDALIEMDGIALKKYHDLHIAVTPHKAGDMVHIAWVSGPEFHEADMTLSGRKIPHVPSTPAELAEETHHLYARLNAELDEILDGVSEDEAEYRPAENEWNIKEILAHLITTERALQIWVANAIDDQVFENWASNDHRLVKSIVDIHSALPHLAAELRRTGGQTVALLQRLPAEILDYKGAYHNVATYVSKDGLPIHGRLHYETIKTLIEEARSQ